MKALVIGENQFKIDKMCTCVLQTETYILRQIVLARRGPAVPAVVAVVPAVVAP